MAGYQTTSLAQSKGGIGLKGGLNYNSNARFYKDAEVIWGDPANNMGYHLGLFGKVNAGPLFLRPELIYTNLKSEINSVQYTTQRLDAPLLVGIQVLGLVSVFGGPSLHYYLQDQLREFDYERLNTGYQFGVGLSLGNVGLDLRYERVLDDQTIDIDNVLTGAGDFKFQQLILGLSLRF